MSDPDEKITVARGYALRRGYEFGLDVEVTEEDREHAYCDCVEEVFCDECAVHAAFEAEMNARQYSDFCFETARWGEEQWEAYEEELASAIESGVKRRIKEKMKTDKFFFAWYMGARDAAGREG